MGAACRSRRKLRAASPRPNCQGGTARLTIWFQRVEEQCIALAGLDRHPVGGALAGVKLHLGGAVQRDASREACLAAALHI